MHFKCGGAPMTLNYDELMARRSGERSFSYSDNQVLLYNLGIGMGRDPACIAEFDVRFTAPVYPGEVIHTDIWIDAETISFRSRVEARGIVSLNNGRCMLRV
jgi:MaoC like domain